MFSTKGGYPEDTLGGYPELNREHTVPHTAVLPIELHPPKIKFNFYLYDTIILE